MHPVSGRFLAALRASHTATVKVDAYLGEDLLAADLPVVSGAVTVDRASAVRRQLTCTLADPALLLPAAPDPLAPYGLELHVARGIVFTSGAVEWVPLGVFRIDDLSDTAAGSPITVTGPDRAKAVADAAFLAPEPSVTTNTVAQEIARLVHGALPDVAVTNVDVDDDPVPALVWDRDRWQAVLDLAAGMGAEVSFAPDGDVVLRAIPAISNALAWFVDAGPDGVLVGASRKITRQETYNAVVAVGERSDGVPPARAFVSDDDPTSATYWGGAFGHVPYFFSSPIITTTGGATRAATGLLDAKRALGRSVSLSCVPNPALDVGDVIGVRLADGTLERHMVDRLSIPLGVGDTMSIETRTPEPTLVISDLPLEPSPDPVEDTEPDDPGSPDPDDPSYDPDLDPGLPHEPPYDGDYTPTDPGPEPDGPDTQEWPQTITFTHVIEGGGGGGDYAWSGDFVVANLGTLHVEYLGTEPPDPGGFVDHSFTATLTGVDEDESGNKSVGVGWDTPAGWTQAGSFTWTSGQYGATSTLGIVDPTHPSLVQQGAVAVYRLRTGDDAWASFPVPPADGLVPAADEIVGFAYLPETLPHITVKLAGVDRPPHDGWDVNYLEGFLTVLPGLGAQVGQELEITYTTNGTVSAYNAPEPELPPQPPAGMS